MSKTKYSGVHQKEDGNWYYRFTIVVDGKTIVKKRATDEDGKPFKTAPAAYRAREIAIIDAKTNREPKQEISRRTVEDVYNEYAQQGRKDRAYKTILKQDSLWRNHFSSTFGNRYVDEISVAEVKDYLAKLYYEDGYSFQYTQSFLKMFYLIFGQAYSRNYLDVDSYNKLCLNKDTKISMPKRRADDDDEIVAFTKEELKFLDNYFKGTNAETAYLLGKYCGLRINECFGLKWDNVNLEEGTIRIDRQMQYQEGLIKLVPVKTRNGNRTIYLCQKMKDYLTALASARLLDEERFKELRFQKQRMIEDIDGEKISSTVLVNCLPNGTIQTVNSFKYPSRELKSRYHINFKYHFLRHTFGTMMAEMNTPEHLLCNQMGHANLNITHRYYIAISKSGIEVLKENLNKI